jgi:hypothetical protein
VNGRRVHVVAFGVTLYCLTLIVFNLTDRGRLGEAWSGDLVGIGAAASASLLTAGWWGRRTNLMMVGLIVATTTLLARSLFLLFIGYNVIGVWLGLSVAFITAGTYVREAHSREAQDAR